ncbi:membrane protein insertase YidC, partial [Gemmatimonadota bacterium]
MRTEIRFFLAVVLMVGVLVITNIMFPPIPPGPDEGPQSADSIVPGQPVDTEALQIPGDTGTGLELEVPVPEEEDPLAGMTGGAPGGEQAAPGAEGETGVAEGSVVVESPLIAFTFSTRGARLTSARLLNFASLTFPGPVELVHPDGEGALGHRILVGPDTVDFRNLPFVVEPADGLRIAEGSGPQTLRFIYQHPTHPLNFEVVYTFRPDEYLLAVSGRVTGLDAEFLITDLGTGLPFNEQREQDEARTSAYVVNHLQEGIRAERLDKVETSRVEEGPFLWAAFKSKYFLEALLAGENEEEEARLGGLIVEAMEAEHQAKVAVSQALGSGGEFSFRVFMGPQDFALLANLGEDLKNVNPYGWKFFRPIVRPFVGIIMTILVFLHENLNWGYGWVLILFGLLMRVVLFPLNQKAMKAQMKNMAVQPLLQEIQTKYKDTPEKLQKEMMKLYKEHGFNPLAG